jgi:hypothetical protein
MRGSWLMWSNAIGICILDGNQVLWSRMGERGSWSTGVFYVAGRQSGLRSTRKSRIVLESDRYCTR